MKLSITLLSIVFVFGGMSTTLAFDPFAAPPKNMAEPTGAMNPQSVTPIEVDDLSTPPPPPPPGSTADEEPVDGITEITGRLLINEEIADEEKEEGMHAYLLETETETIELNTTKDLDMFVGQMVTVYTEEIDGETSIRSLTISEANVDDFLESIEEVDIPAEEMVKPEETEKTASTGPSAYLIGAAVLFVFFVGTLLFITRKKTAAPVDIPENRTGPYDQ